MCCSRRRRVGAADNFGVFLGAFFGADASFAITMTLACRAVLYATVLRYSFVTERENTQKGPHFVGCVGLCPVQYPKVRT
jgi:hypothetical protein